jgi:hypothetical protein
VDAATHEHDVRGAQRAWSLRQGCVTIVLWLGAVGEMRAVPAPVHQ